jgi:hypothetical protein
MLFSRISKKVRKRQSAWLYSAVFSGTFSTFLILLLIVSFFIQPFHKALAAEPFVAEEEVTPVVEDVREQIDDPIPVEESPPEEVVPEEPTDTPDETGDLEVPEEPEVIDDAPDTETESLPEEEVPEEPAPETEEVSSSTVEQVVQVESLITEDNFYQFSKQSCVAVGEGAYHCSTSTEGDVDSASVVYSELDAEGDMEIFLRTSKNKVKQITNNNFDDTAPHYDAESMKVVWQRLIDGRQQIVVFDIMEDEETQLTFSKTNNMEPKVSDAGIVWQAWDNNDWEIMLFDGSYTDQLTDNNAQDVAPVIQDGYVLWNVLGGEEQQARVYSLDTKEVLSIEGHEGGSIINPRFVLVYDTKYENGDIVTQSLDPTTGLSEPIAAKPAPEPVNIPESDPIGEIRALISNKSKDENLFVEVDIDSGDNPPVPDDTLNLKAPDDNQSPITISSSTPAGADFELTEYDLVIPENALEDALSQ